MELAIVVLVVVLAAGYLGRMFYRQFTGRAGCSAGCSCSKQDWQMCQADHSSLKDIDFK